jgi:PPK2 family polyphosphate:nucleotide phosphotransferase
MRPSLLLYRKKATLRFSGNTNACGARVFVRKRVRALICWLAEEKDMQYTWRIARGAHICLSDFDPAYRGENLDKNAGTEALRRLGTRISALQEMLAAAHQHSVLMILQGTDTSGKDGTIRHVFAQINPQGCAVHSFRQPTQEELDHDFLWRVHSVVPGRGILGIFNRSHYEDVLVARVRQLVPDDVWKRRYAEINRFEKLLAANGTIMLKFFLHISAQEQQERLLARENDPERAWKLSATDWEDRRLWDQYQQAYTDMLTKCSTPWAPWYIVPANHKWFRNLAIAHTLVHTLTPYQKTWERDVRERGQRELALVKKARHP